MSDVSDEGRIQEHLTDTTDDGPEQESQYLLLKRKESLTSKVLPSLLSYEDHPSDLEVRVSVVSPRPVRTLNEQLIHVLLVLLLLSSDL